MIEEMELIKKKSSSKQGGEQDMFSTATKDDLFSMVNASEIFNIQEQRCTNIVNQLGLSYQLARAMLVKSGWDEEAAINGFLSDPNYIKSNFQFSLDEGAARY